MAKISEHYAAIKDLAWQLLKDRAPELKDYWPARNAILASISEACDQLGVKMNRHGRDPLRGEFNLANQKQVELALARKIRGAQGLPPRKTPKVMAALTAVAEAEQRVLEAAIAWRSVTDRHDQEGIDADLDQAIDRMLAARAALPE